MPDKKIHFRTLRVKVNNDTESRMVQDFAFKCGLKWIMFDDREYRHASFFNKSYNSNFHNYYLILTQHSKLITFGYVTKNDNMLGRNLII